MSRTRVAHPELRRLIKAAVRAGWQRVDRNGKVLLRAPDGATSVTLHTSHPRGGCPRGIKNERARLRKAGVDV